MLFIALKNLLQEKTRLLISVGGVAFSVLLILILLGLYQGFKYRMGEYIQSQEADFWIGDDKARDMFHSVSILPLEMKEKIESIDGVEKAEPFLSRQVVVDVGDTPEATYLVGYDKETGAGGPSKMVDGKGAPEEGEIIVDKVFADNQKLSIGENLKIGEDGFKVVGISEGTNLVTFQYSFISRADAERIFNMRSSTSYFLIRTTPGADEELIHRKLSDNIKGITVFSKEEFIERNTEFIEETFLPIVAVLLVIGFVVGVIVIGLTIFTSTIEKSQEYGVLKAIGVRNLQLYQIVFAQSLFAGLVGFTLGSILAFVVNFGIVRLVPEFITLFRPIDFVWILLASLVMSLIATYIPIRRIANINPAEVFKG